MCQNSTDFLNAELPDSFSYEVWQATTTLYYKTTPLSAKANIIILSINALIDYWHTDVSK